MTSPPSPRGFQNPLPMTRLPPRAGVCVQGGKGTGPGAVSPLTTGCRCHPAPRLLSRGRSPVSRSGNDLDAGPLTPSRVSSRCSARFRPPPSLSPRRTGHTTLISKPFGTHQPPGGKGAFPQLPLALFTPAPPPGTRQVSRRHHPSPRS